MDNIFQLFKDPYHLIEYGGVLLILIIIYLETGFFLGLVLPGGDYLVFTAGLLCGTNYLDIPFVPMMLLMMAAAILGDFTGYLKGKWLGPKLFNKPDSRFFKQEYLVKTRHYYEKYGVLSFILGRFLPVIRTLVPILAGASGLKALKFSYFNLIGGIIWIGTLTSLGFFLGERFPGLLKYSIFFLIGFFIMVSLPVLKIIYPGRKKAMKKKDQKKIKIMDSTLLWVGFNVFVLIMLALDLGVFHRKAHEVGFREAVIFSVIWIALALLFNLFVWYEFGKTKAVEYLTGYLIEKSLSVDNIFVFVLLFNSFNVPSAYQHKVLFWGVIGALLMRAIFIFAGVALIERFHWIIYVFGIFLVYTGIRIAREKGTKMDISENKFLKLMRRFVPFTREYHGPKFFVRLERTYATPLFLVLILIEFTDLIFAIDSIPAILAITSDPFIVYTSNVFAIMGLRSLYFALAGSLKYFVYLHYGLALILIFVGIKMVVSDFYKLNPFVSLLVIALILGTSIFASIVKVKKLSTKEELTPGDKSSL